MSPKRDLKSDLVNILTKKYLNIFLISKEIKLSQIDNLNNNKLNEI